VPSDRSFPAGFPARAGFPRDWVVGFSISIRPHARATKWASRDQMPGLTRPAPTHLTQPASTHLTRPAPTHLTRLGAHTSHAAQRPGITEPDAAKPVSDEAQHLPVGRIVDRGSTIWQASDGRHERAAIKPVATPTIAAGALQPHQKAAKRGAFAGRKTAPAGSMQDSLRPPRVICRQKIADME
jgi:hypothetical protein